MVFAIGLKVENGATALSHLTIDPVYPAKVSKPLVLPEQIVVPPVAPPGIVSGATIIVIELEVAFGTLTQALLETTAHVTTSLLFNVLLANVAVVTVLIPFTFH